MNSINSLIGLFLNKLAVLKAVRPPRVFEFRVPRAFISHPHLLLPTMTAFLTLYRHQTLKHLEQLFA